MERATLPCISSDCKNEVFCLPTPRDTGIIIPEGEHGGIPQGAKPRGASQGARTETGDRAPRDAPRGEALRCEVSSRGPLLKGDYPVSRGVGEQNNILS